MCEGELELTLMRHTCRAANLRTLLDDPDMRPKIEELILAYERLNSEDRRGTRHRESVGLSGSSPQPPHNLKRITLDAQCMKALITYLNDHAGEEKFIDARELRRLPGSVQLLDRAFHLPSVQVNGVTFKAETTSSRDSNVIFTRSGRPEPNAWSPGRIERVFQYSYRNDQGMIIDHTYLLVKPFKSLSPAHAMFDFYRKYKYVGGCLFYNTYGKHIIITPEQVIAHFARTPMDVPHIPSPCIHALPLDKVRLVCLY